MEKQDNVEAVVEEVSVDDTQRDDTQYASPEIIVRTPQEAAEEVLTPPASSEEHRADAQPISQTLPPGVKERYVEGDTIVEVMADTDASLPTAASGDEDYQARLVDDSVNYTQDIKEAEEGEVLAK